MPIDAPKDHLGHIDEAALWGTALELAGKVGEIVDLTRQPVELDQIREIAKTLVEWCYDEHHYLEHSQWFTTMRFPDGSHITWGEEDA